MSPSPAKRPWPTSAPQVWAVSLTEHQAMLDEIFAAPQLLVLVSGNLAPSDATLGGEHGSGEGQGFDGSKWIRMVLNTAYVDVYIHTHIHIYICICMYIYMYMYVYIYMYMYIYICICMYVYIYIYVYVYMYIYIYVCMYVYIYVYIYICVCVYIYNYMCNMYIHLTLSLCLSLSFSLSLSLSLSLSRSFQHIWLICIVFYMFFEVKLSNITFWWLHTAWSSHRVMFIEEISTKEGPKVLHTLKNVAWSWGPLNTTQGIPY